ncbi:MAG: RNase adapter RapZ [Synergistaceae bacterium]|jgi:UPF0042 nucleotide-binding protein|nr:RNase adapter RapZ [Synergistaceae bacterium]
MSHFGRCVIITGLSGAGKSVALRILEDNGWFATDNIPPSLLPMLTEELSRSKTASCAGAAIVVDARSCDLLDGLASYIEIIRRSIADVKVLFLDASDEWLVRRYETTRRRHPFSGNVTMLDGIRKERTMLGGARAVSDIFIDTSQMSENDLMAAMLSEFGISDAPLTMIISSFGFKNGIPKDCDYMFDVRFLPNPNYVPELKKLSGVDPEVRRYLDQIPEKRRFMEQVESLLEFVGLRYKDTGKKQMHVAIGCTGGWHRSVAVAEELAERLSGKGYKAATRHRDIDRECSR